MKHVWIFLGENGVRKSSVIRCLTGLQEKFVRDGKAPDCEIWRRDGGMLPFNVYMRSIQEHVGPNEITPEMLVQQVEDADFDNVIIALHDDARTKAKTGASYVDALRASRKISIEWIVSMAYEPDDSPEWIWSRARQIAEFPNSAIDPSTKTAAEMRSMFGWA